MTPMIKILLCVAAAAQVSSAGRARGHASSGHASSGHAGMTHGGGHSAHAAPVHKGKEGKASSYSTIVPVTTYTEGCPASYEMEGNQCVKTISTPVMQKCPPGSIQSGSSSSGKHGHGKSPSSLVCRVVTTAPVESVCPLGYEPLGSACSKSETAIEEETCPLGYTAVDGECVKAETFAPVHVCPTGTTKKHNNKMVECLNIQHENPIHMCQDGYELRGQQCLRKTAASPIKFCMSGYEMEGDECVKATSVAALHKCPEGFAKHGSTCQSVTSATPDAVCEEGFELLGSTCMKKLQADYLHTCPAGFDQTADECTATSAYPVKRSCPHGSHARHGGGKHGAHGHLDCTVVHVETAQMTCPEGFEMSAGTNHCIMSESAEEEVECPAGYDMVGEDCIKMEMRDMHHKCPAHTKKEGDQCVVTETAPLEHGCPEGTQSLNGKCVTEEAAEKEMKCPTGYSLSEQVGADGGALCEKCADEKHHKSTGACSYVPGKYHCPPGFTKKLENGSKTECLKVNFHTPTSFCPEGFEATSSGVSALHHTRSTHHQAAAPVMQQLCVRKNAQEMEQYCPSGYDEVDGSCQKEVKHMVSRSCPTGFSGHGHGGRHGGGHHQASCLRMTTKMATPICPAEFELKQNSCVKHSTELPEESCPPGTDRVGEECVITKTAPMKQSCPPGYVKSSKGGMDCYKKTLAQPKHVCPTGYELKGKQCIQTDEADMLEFCQDGSDPVEGKCLGSHSVAPKDKCPELFTREVTGKFDCVRLETAAPTTECASGFELQGNSCSYVEKIEPEIECPAGAAMTDDGTSCVLEKRQVAQRSCPSGFSHGHGSKGGHHGGHHASHGCSKLLTAAATYACPDGFTLNTQSTSSRMRGSPVSTCTATEILAPEMSCSNGAELIGDSCVTTSVTPMVKQAHTEMKKKTKSSYYSDI